MKCMAISIRTNENTNSDRRQNQGKILPGRDCRIPEASWSLEEADEKTDENASPSQMEQVKEKEGQRLLYRIRGGEYCIVLAIGGKKLDSVAFSQQIDRLMVSGTSTIDFVIGGSLGLYKDVLSRADFLLSFSDMTFPHQLMRVILLEQVYRAFRISNKEPYHK